ncbi:hypothetical protein CspHIS471_0206240 [Cutaneotrichosporon sp. HIS471]|nr:hypothetical protein CspHIS471_0206240 [Cutaneotrichosporon sp. HIS471]
MRQPRRVPWSSKAELGELYEFLFSPAANDESRAAALSRMSVYISSPSCPAFIHLLHALVSALALPYPPPLPLAQSQRMVYAMALIRFVNGMVDPLQTGGFARPISHLAAELNLPPGLVALRHRATHEDLPPLEHLHRALQDAVAYLHTYSFVPLLNHGAEEGWGRRERSETLVGRWKKVMKERVRTRDVSIESASGRAVKRLKREFEGEELEDAVEAIVRVGLVPVARKKRPGKKATAPPADALLVWTPLLAHLMSLHENTPSVLAETLTSALLETAPRHRQMDDDERKELASYRWTLGTWLLHFWLGGDLGVPDDAKRDILVRLARELVHGDDVLERVYGLLDSAGLAGLQALLPDHEEEEEELEGLDIDDEEVDADTALEKMQTNLDALEDKLRRDVEPTKEGTTNGEEIPGWHKAEDWRPCPIGMWA